MIRCGYLVDDNISLNHLIAPPHGFDKIELTHLRSKFIVIGTKDEIFSWLEHYEGLVCEFEHKNHDQEITFELYNEEEKEEKKHHHHHHHHHLPKFLSFGTKKYNGSTRMRLEINARNYDDNISTSHPTLAIKGKNGTTLRFVLNAWEKHRGKSKTYDQNKLRSARDYE